MKNDPGETSIRYSLFVSLTPRRRVMRVAAATALLAMSAAFSGCGEGSSAADAITQASADLRILAASPPQDPEARDREFQKIASKLTSVSAEGATAAAAAGLLFEAQLAQGRARSEIAGARSAEIDAAGRHVRENAIFFELAASRAAALRGVDTSPQRNALQSERATLGSEIEGIRAERVRTIGTLAALQSERDQATERAREYRAQARALRERARGVVGLQAASLAEQAAARDRAADEAEGAAAQFDALASALSPVTNELDLQARGADRRVEMVNHAGVSLDRWSATAREISAEAQTLADTRGRGFTQSVGTLRQAITEFEQISASAEQAFSQAGSSAARVARDTASRQSGKLSEASAKQALASVLAERAAAYAGAAESLAFSASRTPAPPDAQSIRREADGLRTKAAEAAAAASEALEEAATIYESIGGSDDRMARIASRLRAESSGRPAAPGTMGEFDYDDSGPAGEIRAEIMRVAGEVTQGNFPTLLDMIQPQGATAERLVQSIRPLFEAAGNLDAACRANMGQGFFDMFGGADSVGLDGEFDMDMPDGFDAPAADPVSMIMFAMSNAEFEEQPDGSVLVHDVNPGDSEPLRFINVEGQWKLTLEVPADFAQMLPMVDSALPAIADLLKAAARDVNDGRISTPDELQQYLMSNPMVGQLIGMLSGMSMGGG